MAVKQWRTLSALVIMLLLTAVMTSQTVAAEEPGLQDGDLFVGAGEVRGPFGSIGRRIIWRVRDSVAEHYCVGTSNAADAEFFGVPEQMMVDSDGRIVFIAKVGPEGFRVPRGLFRCDGMGSTVERLAYFSLGSEEVKEGFPDPFPDQAFNQISGLHLATVQSIEITADHQRLITEDAYVMAIEEVNPETGARIETKVRRYRATTGQWDIAPDAAKFRDGGALPAMVNYGGATYSSNSNVLRKSTDPLRVNAAGSIGDFDFELSLSLFGGHKEVSGLLLDNLDFPNVNSGCDPELPQPPSLMEPKGPTGAYSVMTSFEYDIAYDGYGGLGLVLRSPSGGTGVPYLTNVSEALINDDPGDDLGEWFYRSTTGCRPEASLKHSEIVPFTNPDTGESNELRLGTMTPSPHGLVGMVGHPATRLVRIVPGQGLETIADGFVEAGDVAAYPAVVPPASGTVVLIQINSPVDVLVTDADGNRIGVDPATGEAVNDFGQNGFDSGPGEPRFLAIKDPTPGAFDVDAVGTGEGPFSIQLYSALLGQPAVDLNKITVSGTASLGSTSEHDFTLASDATIAFEKQPDTTPPVVAVPEDMTVEATGPDGASVSYTATATDEVDGPVDVTCDPPSGATFPLGLTTVECSAMDSSGNTGSASFTITVVDTTLPVLSLPADRTVEAEGPDGAVVTYTATAADLVDGDVPVTCEPPSGSTFPLDTTTVSCTAEDAAGNEATASFTVTVVDTTPPQITAPANVTVEGNTTGGATGVDLGSATPFDLVDPAPVVTNDAPAFFPLGDTVVTWTATDASGNSASATQIVTVMDTTPPQITAPANITVEATSADGAVVNYDVTAADIVDPDPEVSCEPTSGSTFPIGETMVQCTATDSSGNEAAGSFTVTVTPLQAELTIESVITAVDDAVAAGTLVGDGPGNSAAGRLDAWRNMLNAARALIEAGDIAGACGQLQQAYLRVDGDPQPPDFVTGAAVGLAQMVLDLMADLGCP